MVLHLSHGEGGSGVTFNDVTRPRGHRPLFCSSVTSTPSFYPTIIVKRRRLSRRSMLGAVVDSAPRTVSLSSSRLLPSPSHNLTSFLRLPLSGMRALSPTLMLPSSPHSIGSPNRYSATVRPSLTSNLCLRVRIALNSQACAHNRAWWILLRTLYSGRRCFSLSLRKRIPPSVSSSLNR
jgi:hypothetical protein